jgi:hypothetical protein
MEEAMERLEQARRAADARVRPWQAAIAPGQCFIADGEDDLVVFGEVLEGYAEPRLRHYRFCRCHSVACPEGELGDVHVSTIQRRISREEFEQARAGGWAVETAGGNPGGPPGPICHRAAERAELRDRCPRDSTCRRHHLSCMAQGALKGVGASVHAPLRVQPLRRPSPKVGVEVMTYGGEVLFVRQR